MMTLWTVVGVLGAACIILWQAVRSTKKDIKFKDFENETIKKRNEALERSKKTQQDILNIASNRASYDAKRRASRLRSGDF